jgi:hypothetical protein
MNTAQRYSLQLILLVIFSGMLIAQNSVPKITDVKQENDGTMRINWSIGSEDGIDHYTIFRSTGTTGQFSQIGDVPKGTFSFTDNYDLFKTMGKYFRYQIKAFHAETLVSQSDIVGASYNSTSSAAKRTWGSIKAMFR